ncbi:F0F1 ATP synthase subunit epsilon [Deltaproteobacteria bacterium]|nr:F0F1 ATP synthase subunit epsilon [Deltaproteobacteria bacterium]
MGKLFLEIVTPAGLVASNEVDLVIAPGAEGEFGVLPDHINFLSGIVPGELRFDYDGKNEHVSVSHGFAEVSGNKVSILVDSAEKAIDIDIERARKAMERAQERLEKERDTEEIDFLRAESALKKAVSRMKVAERAQ